MNEIDTNCQDEAQPVEKRTVSDWAQRKQTKRWLLCLAATGAGWLPEQEDDAQDEVTEAEYDAAVKAAEAGMAKAAASQSHGGNGRDRIKALVFDDRLLGVVVKRLRPSEAAVFNKQLESCADGEAAAVSAAAFDAAVLWPDAHMINTARERVPNAFKATFPLKFIRLIGMDGGDRVKKR